MKYSCNTCWLAHLAMSQNIVIKEYLRLRSKTSISTSRQKDIDTSLYRHN